MTPTQWRVFVSTGEPGTLNQIAARAILSEVDVIESLQYLLDLNLVSRLNRPGWRRLPGNSRLDKTYTHLQYCTYTCSFICELSIRDQLVTWRHEGSRSRRYRFRIRVTGVIPPLHRNLR